VTLPGDDPLGDDPQAGVVVAGVPAHQLVGLFRVDRVPVDSPGLFDGGPSYQRLA
jgi:hypothetical protein